MRVRNLCLRSPWPALLVLTGALTALAAAAASCDSGSAGDKSPPKVLEVRYAVPGVDDDDDGFDDEHTIYADNPDPNAPKTAPAPYNAYFRVVFSKLLDGDTVEDVIERNDAGSLPDAGIIIRGHEGIVKVMVGTTEIKSTIYYYPSGTLAYLPSGPAIVVTPDPASGLPSDSQITVTVVKGALKDKLGQTLAQDYTSPPLRTQPFAVTDIQPQDLPQEKGGLAAAPLDVVPMVVFNAYPDEASITDPNQAAIMLLEGEIPVPGVSAALNAEDPLAIDVLHELLLKPNTAYTVKVTTKVADFWKVPLAEEATAVFTTGDAPAEDGGVPQPDGGPPPVDGGPPPVDAGPPPVDAGPPPADAAKIDAGPPPADAAKPDAASVG